MLTDLFDDESSSNNKMNSNSKFKRKTSKPDAPRNELNLCGIINQGATCYLNTLLQTLFLTPEFRDGLFSLSPEELGLVPTMHNSVKVRVIPIELQRLFANLLLLDQDACSTNKLTDSFGWTGNEGLQQHDVQELNRILFAAIEQSLVNTKQSQLIQKLYKGTIMNKIHCLNCDTTFEREEEFLDLSLTVQYLDSLKTSLINSYIIREVLDSNNQYKCEKCSKYVDAEKYCQLKTLPPILTLSLLRFTYDMKTYQRIKVLDKFEFPFEIDLYDYLEDKVKQTTNREYTTYELYSVIIHGGSAYGKLILEASLNYTEPCVRVLFLKGGHYHTYIKDVENLGNWSLKAATAKPKAHTKSDETELLRKEIILIRENLTDLEQLDYIKYESPLELLKAYLYTKHNYESINIEQISNSLMKDTGVSWNKSYKQKYGTLHKILKKYNDTFELSQDEKSVKLKLHDYIHDVLSSNYDSYIEEKLKQMNEKMKELNLNEEAVNEDDCADTQNEHWFDFNDSRINCIKSETVKTQFEGKESAYMLFYRRKSLNKSLNKIEKPPNWLVQEIADQNQELSRQRNLHEKLENEINLNIYLDLDFMIDVTRNNLLLLNKQNQLCNLFVDKRIAVKDLIESVVTYCTTSDDVEDNSDKKEAILNYVLSNEKIKFLLLCKNPDFSYESEDYGQGYYISQALNENDKLINFIKKSNSLIISAVNTQQFQIGDLYEPLKLVVKYYDYVKCELNEKMFLFYRNTTIEYLKNFLFENNLIEDLSKTTLTLVLNARSNLTYNVTHAEFNRKILNDFEHIKNYDCLLIDNSRCELSGSVQELQQQQQLHQSHNKQEFVDIQLINCVSTFNVTTMCVNKQDDVKNLKILAISAFSLDTVNYDNCHLRYINQENKETSTQAITTVDILNEYNKNNKQLFLGARLYDTDSVGSVMDEKSNLFALCVDRAPNENEITLKCCTLLTDHTTQYVIDDVKCEVLIEKNETIASLVNLLVDLLQLPKLLDTSEEKYYLKTINWLGDVDQILNNLSKKIGDVKLKNNDYICLTKGVLVEQNQIKLNLWLYNNNYDEYTELNEASCDETQNTLKNLVDNKFCYQLNQTDLNTEFKFISNMICKQDLKLDDVKVKIIELFMRKSILRTVCADDADAVDFYSNKIRLRLLKKQFISTNKSNKKLYVEKYRLKKALYDWHKTLKQLNFNLNEVDLAVQLLNNDDNLNQGLVILDCVHFNLADKSYTSYKEILWNINNGATLNSLKQAISKEFGLESSVYFSLFIAKRIVEKFDWLLVKEQVQQATVTATVANKKTGKAKSSTQSGAVKMNLKLAPYNLDDGDIVSFFVINPNELSADSISNQSFMTSFDLDVKNNQVDLSKLKKQNKKKNGGDALDRRNNRRAEVGITIKTEDFS